MYSATFETLKIYPNGEMCKILKNGRAYVDRAEALEKARERKLTQEHKRELKASEVRTYIRDYNRINSLLLNNNEQARRDRLDEIIRLATAEHNLDNFRRSAKRAADMLLDIAKCNDFAYFLTLTFGGDKIDRLEDIATRKAFTAWGNYMRKLFPEIYYLAVPEYHKKGGLHYHLLVGGVTLEALGAVPAVNKYGKAVKKGGKVIYNLPRWRKGFSTLSEVANSEAAKYYISKYITKQAYDERFYCKRRYHCSRNIIRPQVVKHTYRREDNAWARVEIAPEAWAVSYFHERKVYGVFSRNIWQQAAKNAVPATPKKGSPDTPMRKTILLGSETLYKSPYGEYSLYLIIIIELLIY